VIWPSASVEACQIRFGLAVTAAVFVGVTSTGADGLALSVRPLAPNCTSSQKSTSASLRSSSQADRLAALSGVPHGGIESASSASAVLSARCVVPSLSLFQAPVFRYEATVKRAVFAPARFRSARATLNSMASLAALMATFVLPPVAGAYQ